MIVLITSNGHDYTLQSVKEGSFGVDTPQLKTACYDQLFGIDAVQSATYIFADLERLSPLGLRQAAVTYNRFVRAGLRCLNNPARAMCRTELLTNLMAKRGNPIEILRADQCPKPTRFPIFIREEDSHMAPSGTTYHSQAELESALLQMAHDGVPLRGHVVVEKVSEPYRDGLWQKWGTWRIGEKVFVEHIAVDGNWIVKFGDHAKVTESVTQDELDAVRGHEIAEEIRPAFEVGNIEYGRADHAAFQGRQIVYEINTNPYIGPYVPDKWPLRREAQLLARRTFSEALTLIDSAHKQANVRV